MPRSTLAVLACALALPACDAIPPTSPDVDPSFGRSDEVRVVASATGEYRLGVAPTRFAAIQKGDGRVFGDFHILAPSGFVEGEVVCVGFQDNGAWIGYRITATAHPAVTVGSYGFFRVLDNGEGAEAEPDRASGLTVNQPATTADWYCTNRPPQPTSPLIEGNIQVR
jgi:hypothetical protein